MSRYTEKQLQNDLAELTRELIASGSTYTLQWGHRNGYNAVDLVRIDETGREHFNGLEQGSPRECANAARRFVAGHKGYTFPQKRTDLTRVQAKVLLQRYGIDFAADFHTLDHYHVDVLTMFGKLAGYRAPATASGSYARYFFSNLVKT